MYGGVLSKQMKQLEQRTCSRSMASVFEEPRGSKVVGVEHDMKTGQRGYGEGSSQVM